MSTLEVAAGVDTTRLPSGHADATADRRRRAVLGTCARIDDPTALAEVQQALGIHDLAVEMVYELHPERRPRLAVPAPAVVEVDIPALPLTPARHGTSRAVLQHQMLDEDLCIDCVIGDRARRDRKSERDRRSRDARRNRRDAARAGVVA